MNTSIDFQVGDMVTWTVGRIVSVGCFLEDKGNGMCSVITHFVAGQISNREVAVDKKLLKLNIKE